MHIWIILKILFDRNDYNSFFYTRPLANDCCCLLTVAKFFLFNIYFYSFSWHDSFSQTFELMRCIIAMKFMNIFPWFWSNVALIGRFYLFLATGANFKNMARKRVKTDLMEILNLFRVSAISFTVKSRRCGICLRV